MAGIGFYIQKMLQKDTLSSTVVSVIFSAIVSVGPWLLTSTSLVVLGLLFPTEGNSNYELFSMATIYAFIFSTLASGGLIMVIVRRVADLVFAKAYHQIINEYTGLFLFQGVCSFVGSFLWIFFFGPEITWVRIYFPLLFTVLSLLWTTLAFISVLQKYWQVIIGFSIGSLLAIVFPLLLMHLEQGVYSFFGYILGFGFCLTYLIFMLFKDIPTSEIQIAFSFFQAFKKYPENFFFGLFYYGAIWVDDIIIWFSRFGINPIEGFRFSVIYDMPMFLAYLTIIPSLSLFFLVVETTFYNKYRRFYVHIEKGAQLKELEHDLTDIRMTINHQMGFVIKIQLLVTMLLFVFSPFLMNTVGLPGMGVRIFEIGIIGALFNGTFLMIQLLLLYFEFRKEVLQLSLLVFSVNLIGTLIILRYFEDLLSLSYLLAFLIGSIVAKYILDKRLKHLIRIEYNRQPLGLQKGQVKRRQL